jgi:hypothetical protein
MSAVQAVYQTFVAWSLLAINKFHLTPLISSGTFSPELTATFFIRKNSF